MPFSWFINMLNFICQTDVTTATSDIRQRMWIVGGSYERSVMGSILLWGSIDGAPIDLTL